MVIQTPVENLLSIDARGQFGYTAGCGFARCSNARCGSSKLYGGIYSRKKLVGGWGISRMRVYRPSNPQTVTQQTWRGIFSEGVLLWQSLTQEQKDVYLNQAHRSHMTTFNVFMSEYLREHRL